MIHFKFVYLFMLVLWTSYHFNNAAAPHRKSVLLHRGFPEMSESTHEHHHDFTPAPVMMDPYTDICTDESECVLPVQCPAHVIEGDSQTCRISTGRIGICCTTGKNHSGNFVEKLRGHQFVKIDPTTLSLIGRYGREELLEINLKEAKILSRKSATLPLGTASYGHFRNSRAFSIADLAQVMGVASRALEIAFATRAFKDRQGITNHQLEYGMLQHDLRPTSLGAACLTPPICPPHSPRHRRIDGSCNNLFYTSWGMPMTPYSRLLPPSYQDGIWSPRVSEDKGQPLTSPRLISTTLFHDKNVYNKDYTLMLMQFGQFLSHDITQSIDTSFGNGTAVSCCTTDGTKEISPELRHYSCMPIMIPSNDEFFSAFNQRCMNFVRSVLSPRKDCTLGYAQQMNKVTHYIDGSSIYGSSAEQTRKLRSFEGGRLKVFNDFGRDLPPLSEDPDACLTMEQGSACFTAGDTRINQMVSLTTLHMLFMREHNRLADELHQLNSQWDDEQIFLEARHILVAELQVIIYNEFLPTLLGDVAMEEFDLMLQSDGHYSYDYDQRTDPSILNEFASAAFRFGHSMVDGVLKFYGVAGMETMIDIPEFMFHPSKLRKRDFFDQILNTLTSESIQDVDNAISDALTKYMFRAGNPFGVDLAAINIQRGRDHGLRPYNDYRELVGLPRIKSFKEFEPELGQKLQSVYASVDDIDLWVGGLLEPKHPGSVLGLTFRDIIAEQFSRLKKGDKYFFEHEPSVNPGHFSPDQLREIKKVTLARIICDNRDGILLKSQPPNAFRHPKVKGNEYIDCLSSVLPRVNLTYWKY